MGNSFYIKISRNLWKGNKKAELIKEKYSIDEENYDIHLEFIFYLKNKNIAWLFHYETNPYIPHKKLLEKSQMENYTKCYNRESRLIYMMKLRKLYMTH